MGVAADNTEMTTPRSPSHPELGLWLGCLYGKANYVHVKRQRKGRGGHAIQNNKRPVQPGLNQWEKKWATAPAQVQGISGWAGCYPSVPEFGVGALGVAAVF